MNNLQIRGKRIRQPSSSKSSRRHLAITGDLDQILSKYHSYNFRQVIKHSCEGITQTRSASTSGFRTKRPCRQLLPNLAYSLQNSNLSQPTICYQHQKRGGPMCFHALVPVLATGHLQRNQDVQPSHLHLLLCPPEMKGPGSTLESLYPLVMWSFPSSLNHPCLHMTRDWKGWDYLS